MRKIALISCIENIIKIIIKLKPISPFYESFINSYEFLFEIVKFILQCFYAQSPQPKKKKIHHVII